MSVMGSVTSYSATKAISKTNTFDALNLAPTYKTEKLGSGEMEVQRDYWDEKE